MPIRRGVCRAIALVVAVSIGGCWNAADRRQLRRWAQQVVDDSGARVEVRRCVMFEGTRNGYCLVGGRPADVAMFVGRLALEPHPEPREYSGSCMALDAYGVAASPAEALHGSAVARAPRPGASRFAPPRSAVPLGEGPRFSALMVAPSADEACLEFRF
jgi:hypothetical protein